MTLIFSISALLLSTASLAVSLAGKKSVKKGSVTHINTLLERIEAYNGKEAGR